jgi:hypothetical protein
MTEVLRSSAQRRRAPKHKEDDIVLLLPAFANEGVELLHEKVPQRPLLLISVLGEECT